MDLYFALSLHATLAHHITGYTFNVFCRSPTCRGSTSNEHGAWVRTLRLTHKTITFVYFGGGILFWDLGFGCFLARGTALRGAGDYVLRRTECQSPMPTLPYSCTTMYSCIPFASAGLGCHSSMSLRKECRLCRGLVFAARTVCSRHCPSFPAICYRSCRIIAVPPSRHSSSCVTPLFCTPQPGLLVVVPRSLSECSNW